MKHTNFLLKGWLLAVFICLNQLTNAQVATQYTFSQSAGAYLPITGGTVIFSGTFDDLVSNVSIPSFYYDGNFYNSVNVSTNGFISFGATSPGTSNYAPLSSTTAYQGAIAAFGRDLNQGATGTPEIRYEQVGNEVVFQYQDVRRYSQAELISFQIRLNLSNAEIRIVYNAPTSIGTSTTYPQVGLRGPSNAFATDVNNRSVVAGTGDWINSVAGTANNSTCYFNNADPLTIPSSGLTFTWTPVSLPTNDAALSAISSPQSGCSLSSSEQVTVSVSNPGFNPISTIDISYQINGGPIVTETASVFIPSGGSVNYTFTAPADLSATGVYSFKAWTNLSGDINNNNDTVLNYLVEHFVPVSAPISEDFESFTTATNATGYANGWSTNPAATTTAFRWNVQTGGTPTTGTGPSADHTTGSGKYIFTESSSGATGAIAVVESPCIDLAGLTNPGMEFWYHKFGTNMGDLYVDVYSSGMWSTVDSVIGQTQTSNADAWLKKLVNLTAYNGQVIKVRFRALRGSSITGDMAIDDINIADFSDPDLSASVIVSPVTSCGLTGNELVEVTYTNIGLVPVTSFNAGYILNNGTPVIELVTTTLNSGDTYTHTFAATIDLSLQGNYVLKVFNDLANDVDLNNDTLTSSIDNIPSISGFPQFQDFESNDGGWIPTGASMNWEWGTPSNSVINSSIGCGDKAWVTGLTADYPALSGAVGYLTSPCFDLSSSATDPKIRFDQILDLESCCDETWLEYSLDAGVNWTKVGASGTGVNWYNDATNQWWDLATSNGWRSVENTLTGAAGNDQVRIRFAFSSDGSVQNEGVGIDNLMIFEDLVEATPFGFSAPVSSCSMSSAEVLTAEIRNNGSDTIFTIQACYSINGGAFVCETINDTLLVGQVFSYDFTATGDFSVPGNYDLTLAISLSGDLNTCNDTITTSITSIPTISTFPMVEDFELDNGLFVASGTNSNWEWGTPSNSVINASNGCGNNAWVTGLTTDYNNSTTAYLTSPCLDLSGVATDPKIRFDQILDLESCCDETWIESSIDGGVTWNKIGLSGTGVNWFNDATNQWWDLASTNGWRQVQNTLTGLAGQSSVLIRLVFSSDGSVSNEGVGFDNLMIFEDLVDAQPGMMNSPVSDCGLTNSEIVEASFLNNGTDSIFSMNVCYIVNGGAPICEVLNDTILPGASYNFTFATTVDLSVAGSYTIQIVSGLAGDVNTCSDTVAFTVTNKPLISSYPYFEDFENGEGGWESIGGSWAFGTPAKTVITGAGSGSNAWVTGGLGTGNYSNNESSSVQSPCFDFTTLPANPWVALKVWWNSENSWDGTALQMSRDNGSNWTTIGTFAPATQNFPYNWYNDNSISGNPGGQALGWTGVGPGQWLQASHPLDTTGFGNATNVIFRVAFGSDGSVNGYDGFAFDDFAIGTLPALPLADTTVCGGYSMPSGYSAGLFTWESQNTTTLAQTVIGNASSVTLNNTSNVDSTLNVLLTFTDEFGFTNFDTALVTLHPAPLSDFGPDTAICYNDTLVLFADSGAGYTYTWNTGSIQDSILVTAEGDYFVIVTDNVSGCSHQEDIFVHITPALNLAASAAVCDGDSVLLDVGPQYFTYNWNTGETTQGIYASTAGTYLVNVTDSIGCASADSIEVVVNPLPSVSLGGDQTICTYTSTTLDAGTGFTSYLWSNLANTQTITVNGASLGAGSYTYSVRVTDGNGCQDTDTITVVVDLCVGVEEMDQANQFTILPNPNNGQFAIDLGQISGDILMEVLSADGKLVSTEQISSAGGRRNFEMGQLERGVYFVRISHLNGISVMRMVIQK